MRHDVEKELERFKRWITDRPEFQDNLLAATCTDRPASRLRKIPALHRKNHDRENRFLNLDGEGLAGRTNAGWMNRVGPGDQRNFARDYSETERGRN